MLGGQLAANWPYFVGIRALQGGTPLAEMPCTHVLAMVQSSMMQRMNAEQLDEFEGWMTCTWEQAQGFISDKVSEEQADRMTVARAIGMG